MKKYIVLCLLVPFFTFSQSNDKNTKDTFSVEGNCSMCKKRIEKAALSLKGVKYAKWTTSVYDKLPDCCKYNDTGKH